MVTEQAPKVENLQLEQNRMHALTRLAARLQTPEETFLREHQMSMVQSLYNALKAGGTAGYMSEPTGAGKTPVALEISRILGLKTAILSPTQGIVRETKGKSERHTPDLSITNYYADEKDLTGQVINTTFPSAIKLSNQGEKSFKPEEVGLLICDESDLALGEETHKIFRRFPNAIFIGLTATPYFDPLFKYIERGIVKENERWVGLFRNLWHEMTLEEGMERGVIIGNADIHLVKSNVMVSDIEIQSGEYKKSELKRFFDKVSRNMLAVGMIGGTDKLPKDVNLSEDQRREIDIVHNKIKGKRTLVFGVDIDHADTLVKLISDQGISARAAHSKVEDEEGALDAHRKGESPVLVGVDSLGRGRDLPSTEVVIHLRPTRSGRVLMQQFGRVLRLSPETGKEKAIAIQVVDQFRDKADAPVFLSDIFDPTYVLRGAATGIKPSEHKSSQLSKRPIVTFSGMKIDSIVEEAKARDLLQTRFKQGSIAEISNFLQKLAEDVRASNPYIGIYDLFKTIVGELPSKMPFEVQQKALQAFASMDINTRRLGQEGFLLLNMKTLITVVDSFYIEGIDTKEERDEMLSSAITAMMQNLSSIKPNFGIAQEVNKAARDGVSRYISKRDNVPITWIKTPENRILIVELAGKIKNMPNELNDEEIQKLAQDLSAKSGINEGKLVKYIAYLDTVRPEEKVSQKDTSFEGAAISELEDSVKEVLNTLTQRERFVLERRFGLIDGRTRTFEEVGVEIGVTRERIRQIEAKALRKMRHPSRIRKLTDYLEQ